MENLKKNKNLVKLFIERAGDIRRQNKFQEFYSVYFSRFISCFITSLLTSLNITPNFVTLSMIFSGVIGSILFLTGEIHFFILGAFFYILLNILDCTDGELARYLNKVTDFGDYLDRVAHYVTNMLIFISVGIGIFIHTSQLSYIYFSILLLVTYVTDDILRDLLTISDLKNSEDSRKVLKKNTSITVTRKYHRLNLLIKNLSSNVSFFHFLFIFSLIDFYIYQQLMITKYYYLIFCILSIIKIIFRILIINNLKRN